MALHALTALFTGRTPKKPYDPPRLSRLTGEQVEISLDRNRVPLDSAFRRLLSSRRISQGQSTSRG